MTRAVPPHRPRPGGRRRRPPVRDRAGVPPVVLLGALLAVVPAGVAGCGAVGDPIAPEDIGIEAKVRAQREAEAQRTAPPGPPTAPREESETTLPPLQPVGVQ